MKRILLPALILSIACSTSFNSCKKEMSCQGCNGRNKPPVANAGKDTIIILPKDSIFLDGSNSYDPDGSIVKFSWLLISGPSVLTIVNPQTAKPIIKNFISGVYKVELKVTDAGGLFSSDTIKIAVNSNTSTNLPPVAIAGNDSLIQSSQTACTPVQLTITLNGSNSYDPDGNIVSYLWTGPGTIANPGLAITTVTGLFQGTIHFSLKVTDNNGAVSIKDVNIIILTGGRPMVNATMLPLGMLSKARGEIAVASAGNKIVFAGGYSNAPDNWFGDSRVDIYDISTNAWSIAELSVARHGIAATSAGNKIFFAGGHTSAWGDVDIGEHATVDIYDVVTNNWSVASLSQPRGYISATSLGNKVFFAGGYWIEGPLTFHYSNTVDIFDLVTNTWTTATLSQARTEISAVAANNKVYFAGGSSAGFDINYFYSDKIDIYDNNTNSWSVSTLNEPKVVSAGFFLNNKIYWAGGYSSQGMLCKVEIRDVNTQTTSLDYLSHPGLPDHTGIKDNRIMFANLWQPFDIFNTNTNSWSVGLLPKKRDQAAVISVNNTIYIAGGWAYESQNYTSHVWKLEF